jgi:hypothetical protein
MTTIATQIVACGVCGGESEQLLLTSTSSFGPPDLDMRPGPPARDALFAHVQRCPACGFCAPSLEEGDEELRPLVGSALYRETLERGDLPELARTFLCAAIVLDDREREAESAWAAIEAAWACDDAGADEAARVCRGRAIEFLHEVVAAGDELVDDLDAEAAVKSDLLRRAGRFEEAATLATATLAEGVRDALVARILALEVELASARDDSAHSIGELEQAEPEG